VVVISVVMVKEGVVVKGMGEVIIWLFGLISMVEEAVTCLGRYDLIS